MTGYGAIVGGCRAFADRHGTDDPPVDVGLLRVMPRSAHGAGAPQVLEQLLLQCTTRLDEKAAVDRLVRHAMGLVVRIGMLEPSGDLFGRPQQPELGSHDPRQVSVAGQFAALGTQRAIPGGVVCVGWLDSPLDHRCV